ncbi:hypothetical protein N7519_010544 [Penicillium mononematosum]|uniref:uncharacterized protein n=1 Tax=Penicillium mononematosum TaxID=268346 RepID=UPI002546C681|nr:uncharacterized protein N7519_010544 [Penicillium mononematosum]KAJ6180083.1 hypothetical protein N7519_010544 [Penicillium mononematosum]
MPPKRHLNACLLPYNHGKTRLGLGGAAKDQTRQVNILHRVTPILPHSLFDLTRRPAAAGLAENAGLNAMKGPLAARHALTPAGGAFGQVRMEIFELHTHAQEKQILMAEA